MIMLNVELEEMLDQLNDQEAIRKKTEKKKIPVLFVLEYVVV